MLRVHHGTTMGWLPLLEPFRVASFIVCTFWCNADQRSTSFSRNWATEHKVYTSGLLVQVSAKGRLGCLSSCSIMEKCRFAAYNPISNQCRLHDNGVDKIEDGQGWHCWGKKQVPKSNMTNVESNGLKDQEESISMRRRTIAAARCPKHFTLSGNWCFTVFTTHAMNHFSAVQRCQEEGENSRLPILKTKERFQMFRKVLKKRGYSLVGHRGFWIGVKRQTPTLFRWDDGSKINMAFWGPKEPNNPEEDCVEMRSSLKYKMNDVDCSRMAYATCEIPM